MKRLHETSIELDVPFHDVDMMGVVWHGHYFKYLEAARTKLLVSCGLDAGDLIGRRFLFLVIESHCRHAFPLRYRDRVRVSAWIRDFQHRIHIAYEVRNETEGRRSARARTILATTDMERNLLLETPCEIRRRIAD
jgi:acyl-CoA thioester hydrolase